MDFEVGDKVVLCSTEATELIHIVTNYMRRLVSSKAVAEVICVDHTDSTICVSTGGEESWFSFDDVITYLGDIKPSQSVDYLDINKVKIGDKVKLSKVDKLPGTVEGYSFDILSSDIACGEELTVVKIDTNDLSVLVQGKRNKTRWVYIKDLVNVESSVEVSTKVKDRSCTASNVQKDTSFIITNDSVTLAFSGDTAVVTSDHLNFVKIRQAVIDGDYSTAHRLMNISAGIKRWGKGSLQIDNGEVKYNNIPLSGKLVNRVISMMSEGDESFKKFANFLNLTMEQESFTTRQRLMDFAANDKLDLTEEGYVIAFKNVRDDFFDKHSGCFDNSVGNTLSMRRADVDHDHDHPCSRGLHVCSPTYLKEVWGTSGRTVKVVVNPKNFVAIPYEYKDSKARVCEYKVIEDVTDKINDYL